MEYSGIQQDIAGCNGDTMRTNRRNIMIWHHLVEGFNYLWFLNHRNRMVGSSEEHGIYGLKPPSKKKGCLTLQVMIGKEI